jgi:hypothetical protein
MKRCIFVGPSLSGVEDRPTEIQFFPPASRGDLMAAVEAGFRWIGLVDGYFGDRASVWHKEILLALSVGCHVWGAASLGALRAAECHRFGMRPVGIIAAQYVAGTLDDDADVALLHAPAEVGFVPLTEALVDVRATIEALRLCGHVSPQEADSLWTAAAGMHFMERTIDAMSAGCSAAKRRQRAISALYSKYKVPLKQMDALSLMNAMRETPEPLQVASWNLATSQSLIALRGSRM